MPSEFFFFTCFSRVFSKKNVSGAGRQISPSGCKEVKYTAEIWFCPSDFCRILHNVIYKYAV